MHMKETITGSALYARPADKARWGDIALILALTVVIISIGMHAPGHSYSYAQMRQMGATVGMIESGNWILPRNHEGRLARKPQLYSWLTAPVLLATGVYTDFTFRWPSVAAALGCGILVYLLGLRWFGRRIGLMGAVFWVTSLHMGKLMYLGTTDMLNAFWLMLAVLCADQVLFASAGRLPAKRWIAALWFAIIMGAMTKGWGVANLPLIAGWIAFTTGLAPGFKSVDKNLPLLRRLGRGASVIWRRWLAAARRIRLLWGILAFAVILGPLWGSMVYLGRDDFAKVANIEIWKRIFGGVNAPKPSSVPTLLWLLFYTLPSSALVLGTLAFIRPGRWLSPKSPTALPLWWIIAVALPFSMAHGFRPDYLLPCYASVTILAAADVDRLISTNPKNNKMASILRHLYAVVVISVSIFVIATPLIYLYYEQLPEFARKAVRMPLCVKPETWRILAALPPLGLGMISLAVWASLKWRIRTLTAVMVAGMVCVLFIDRHMISRHARTGDGQTMIQFADAAKQYVGSDKFAVCRAEKLGAELYWGRFGKRVEKRQDLESLPPEVRWLVTCDRGLVQLGACVPDSSGAFTVNRDGRNITVTPAAEILGDPIDLKVHRPIEEDSMGKPHLIRLPR